MEPYTNEQLEEIIETMRLFSDGYTGAVEEGRVDEFKNLMLPLLKRYPGMLTLQIKELEPSFSLSEK